MIKTIKVKKQLRLDELIKHIFDNGIEDTKYHVSEIAPFLECEVRVSGSGNIKTSGYINEHTTFTVEEEEEITEDTEFEALVFILVSGRIEVINNYHNIRSARSLIENYETEKQIYALINGKLESIWEAEN